MFKWIDLAVEKLRKFNVWELGVFKVCVTSFGVLIGTYAHKTCKKFAPFIWIVCIVSYIILISKFIGPLNTDED